MGDRTNFKFTEAEKMAFRIIPETCPTVEKAFDKASNIDYSIVKEVLPKYNIESSKNLDHAIGEILGKVVFNALHDLRKIVLYEGTFPLRLAIVKLMEEKLLEQGINSPRSNIEFWVEDYKQFEEFKKKNLL
jgi:hypothetical protein